METLSGNLKTVVEGARIIRVHNNTPAMVGAGCSVFSTGEGTTIFKRFFYPLGKKNLPKSPKSHFFHRDEREIFFLKLNFKNL